MTKAQNDYTAHQATGAAYFKAMWEYSRAVRRGYATEEMRLQLVALKEAYYNTSDQSDYFSS